MTRTFSALLALAGVGLMVVSVVSGEFMEFIASVVVALCGVDFYRKAASS